MSIDNKTKTLIVNQVTKEQYKTLVDNSQLIPTELYVIVDDAHYTEQEIITLLMAKQDVLSAGLGVQIVDNTITFDMSNDFYTKEDITELLATKSNVTEAGYTLEYEENYLNLKTIDGEVLSSIIIKSAPDTDGVTISYNDNKELQTIGQITKNNTPKFSWIGTQEEYDRDLEAGIIDEYTECLITDSVNDIIAPVVSFDAPTKLSELANDMNFVVQSDLQNVKDELQADIEAGIDDTNLVHKTGNETIEGFKNFKEKIVIENGLNKGRIAHKPVDTSLEDGYIEFGDNTLIYGKQDVQGEVFDERHDIFHAGNLVAGNNITITKKNGVYKINGQAGGGTGGGSIDNVDNETIIIQDDGSISAQGVLDQNTEDLTAIKFWSGTLEEYNALGEWDDDTIYNVTDDIIETGTEIGANLSLSNLNEEGEARFDAKADKADTLEGYGITNGLNKNQITNCITEIPQNIKLELKDGTLTLKAGSQVIVPNGYQANGTDKKYEHITITKDLKIIPSTSFATGAYFIAYNWDGNYLTQGMVSTATSGGTAPTGNHCLWYNTTNNVVDRTNGSATLYNQKMSFPIAVAQVVNGVAEWTAIDQVFNGFGYIGSTIWVDKGVKGLIPNGRNEDGNLKNIEYAQSIVKVETLINNQTFYIGVGTGVTQSFNYVEQEEEPTSNYTLWYKPSENIMYRKSGAGVVTKNNVFYGIKVTTGNGVVTSFQPELPVRLVRYDEFTELKQNSLNKQQITNCLLEVPQNVKLELADGILTLKAGSKVIVPNGVGVFDEVTIANDVTYTATISDYSARLVYYNKVTGKVQAFVTHTSGEIAPTTGTNAMFYNTTDNTVRRYNDGVMSVDEYSLPLGVITANGEVTTGAIDQVFNGFGYIGSIIWAEKGVSALIANGRNADGTLNNIEYATKNIITRTFTGISGNTSLYLGDNYFTYSVGGAGWFFDEDANYYVVANEKRAVVEVATCTMDNGKISNFKPRLPFRAVDYSDKQEVGGWAMPSSKYTDLTLGATGTQYTAPANGWYYLKKQANGNNQSLSLQTHKMQVDGDATVSGHYVGLILPVVKGDVLTVHYTLGGSLAGFRFVYAQGEI